MKSIFSIRYKFLLVTTLLLVLCVGTYLILAASIMKQDKTELVYDYNRSTVTNIASDLESFFRSVSDRLELSAFFYQSTHGKEKRILKSLLDNDSDTVFVAASSNFKDISQTFHINNEILDTYGITSEFFINTIENVKPIPFEKIKLNGEAIWNGTIAGGPALIGMGRNVIQENENGQAIGQFAIIGFIRADKILSSLKSGSLNEVFVVNNIGEIIAHQNGDIMIHSPLPDELTNKVIINPSKTSVLPSNIGNMKYLSAFSKTFNNQLIVISKVSEAKAFGAVDSLLYRSLSFALILLTMAFIAAILFSRGLTRPIEVLLGGMRKVSDGDLDTTIQVKSHDEISLLAQSFNSMLTDLKKSRGDLENLNKELETKVKDRTRQLELQNLAVKKAQEALLHTSRLAAVGEIAGRAAHEVLNPLTGILTRLQKVQNNITDKNQSEFNILIQILESWDKDYNDGGIEKLVSTWTQESQIFPGKSLFEEDLSNILNIGNANSSNLNELIEDLDFIQKESLRINRIVQSMRSLTIIKGNVISHDLEPIIQECVHIMADLAQEKSIDVHVQNNCKEPVIVNIDRDEFIQSLTNLLRNSVQAIDSQKLNQKGQIEIIIESTQENKILVFVKDNGIGISDENKDKLFETQFSTKSREDGTGLGLNISRRFIRSFGGDIYLKYSLENEGTEFVIELPKVSSQELEKTA